MFKRITPQTIADWGERIYIRFLELTKRFTSTQIMALLAIIVGVLAGLGTCLFELLLYGIKAGLTHWFPVEQSHFLFLFYPVIGIILASLFVKYVVKDNISEGVTRVLYAMSRKNSYIASHNCWTSVVGGATTIGFGGSVGPEAPIVLTGAAIGSNISRLAHLNYKNTTLLLCCGAGAALAAIFKAPITGVVFVLEILMLDLTSRTVVPLLISSITAAAVALTIRGFDPIIAISLTPDDAFRLNQIPLFVLLGIFCGLMSYYFTTVNARVGAFFKKIDSPYKKWLIGGAVLGILIYIFPPLYGEGYEGFMSLMHGNTTELFNNSLFYRFSQIDWVVILFIVGTMFFKVIAMASTNAAGGVGGTFAPSLFVGAFMGAITALVCNTLFGWNLSLVSFTLVGMAGVMSGVMKAPLTSIFLIAELSSGYGLFIPLMITACIAFAIDYYLDPDSIYTKQLRQNGELITHNKDESVFVFLRLDDLIQDDGVYIHPSQTLGDIVQIMSRERHDDYFPVLDNEKHLLGIVRLNDVREDLFNPQKYGNPITRYMLLSPDTILQHEQIQSVLRRFGGTFAPSLFVGAFMGAITALVCNTLFGWNLSLVSFTLVGMAGVMSGVMKAPLTSIFLIAELSSGYGLFIPLMITACIAFAIDYYLDPDSIYTKQLRQNGELITHNKDESVFVFLRLDDLIQDDGVYIHPSQTLGDIVQIMSRERHDDYFPVLDNEKHLLGIVRLNDVREDLFNPQKYGNPITRYMLLSPDTILQHEQIQSVLRRFDENHVWVLPVVDKEKHYLGYISKSRIMTAYREQLVKISQ